YGVRAFLGSFTGDYASIGSVEAGGASVELWVNSISGSVGRDQAQILKQVLDSQFTPKTGVTVNLKLVQQALAPAIFSGRGPDVAAYIPTGDSVNLAARGGLQDLSGMEGFAEFTKAFSPDAFLPHTYNGGVYGVPFTEDFPVLFWRTDIFEQLDIQPPKTWDDFYDVLSVIQKNNMTVGIPNVQGTQMSTNNSIFAMLLYQRGGQYYTEARDATAFDSEAALDAFRQWTDLYKNYSLPVQYSFYQRFRLGDMPMGIENYTMATMLQVAAPEIDGLWEMAPLPGITRSDGTVCNTAIAGGMSTIMLRSAKDKAAGWQLIKWLSSEEAQAAVGIELEALLGPSGRFNPANRAAFDNLPWNKTEAAAIRAQWQTVTFLPQVPGGYYVDRNLTNAFRRTVFYNRNYREALLEYNREIQLEITRKRREFGLD
ncbi:MAG: extracellular solute-binding protein, partial [Oscillospiraceae bacterium]|nr:extracellular solute-binding protein [Oscillospiraceae bacterium]